MLWIDRRFFGKHLEEDETVARIVHKHWMIAVKALFWPVVSSFASLVVLLQLTHRMLLMLVGLWFLGSLVWLLRNFLDYYLDVWIITDHGVIDLEWKGWFHRSSSRVLYSDIQGVSYEVAGIIATMLRFGTVSVEKISTGTTISLPHAPSPRAVEGLILKSMETYLHTKNMKDAKHVQHILTEYVTSSLQKDI
jgi:uncharacterized membrane protein YdbT with pleckstrin-like domain